MDQQNDRFLEFAKSFSKLTLTEDQLEDKRRQEHIAKVNRQNKELKLKELNVLPSLRIHIPREPGKFLRLNEDARKTKRNLFSLHKAFPDPVKFQHGNKNPKLSTALKSIGQRLQSNGKHNLAATIEIESDLHRVITRLDGLLLSDSGIPDRLKEAYQAQSPHFLQLLDILHGVFIDYRSILESLVPLYDKLDALTYLQGDSLSDGIEQVTNIALALRNLRPPKTNVHPTKDQIKSALSDRSHNPRGPWRGRGRKYNRKPGRAYPGGYGGFNGDRKHNNYNNSGYQGNPYGGQYNKYKNNYGK